MIPRFELIDEKKKSQTKHEAGFTYELVIAFCFKFTVIMDIIFRTYLALAKHLSQLT